MTEITAAMVKDLREETGQGMMECKKALQEAHGDPEAAKDILRRRGLATAEKKAARATSEGLIAAARQGPGSAAMIEVDCETDFCARNETFREMVEQVARLALQCDDGEVPATEPIQSAVQTAFNQIGENMQYARGVKISAPKVGSYVHHNGKVGVLVGVDGNLDDQRLADLCMHVAFSDPMGITPEDIPRPVVEKEEQFARQEAEQSGKPADIIEKIVAGKVKKFLAGKALLEQPFVRDDKKKVKDVLDGVSVTRFARFAVGEGQ